MNKIKGDSIFDKKGISLPVNMLVILSTAVIVLLAVVAFFMGAFDTGGMEESAMRSQCCTYAINTLRACDPEYHPNWDELSEVDDEWEEYSCQNLWDVEGVDSVEDACC